MTWLFAIGTALLLGGIIFFDGLTRKILKPPRLPVERTPESLGLEAQDVAFESDGRLLRGWFLDGDDEDELPLVILAHGWGANSGTVMPLGKALLEIGLDVLVFDFRQHGRSDDAPRVTVLDYAEDLRAAVDYARDCFPGRPILLAGHSMGGAAAVLATSSGTEVDGLLLIATPADFFEVTASYMGSGWKGKLMLAGTAPFFLMYVRRWWSAIAPDRHIADVTAPLAIVHGDRDDRVPLSHVERLAEKAGVKPLILQDTGHKDILHRPELHRYAKELASRFSSSA